MYMADSSMSDLDKRSHPFRKKWGQNFLRDPNTINKIVNLLDPHGRDSILEIGPGEGALTSVITEKVKNTEVVEIDPLLVQYLNKLDLQNVKIHQGDILDWNLDSLSDGIKVIGNLPYYISSPILFKFLNKSNWERMIFMFQKELAERIVSKSGNKMYGRISVMCQVFSDVKIEFLVSNKVFQPRPDVDSAVLSFYPKKDPLPDSKLFSDFIKQAFSQRRKKLKNNLSQLNIDGKIEKWAHLRPEAISPTEFIEIYNIIYLG